MIRITGLSFAYEGSADPVFDNVTLQLDTDWKLGLTGRNGRGKTTLLRLLAGQLDFQGRIETPVRFDYFPFPVEKNGDTLEHVAQSLSPGTPDWQVLRELSLLGLEGSILSQPYASLSPGERTRALLAVLFARGTERFRLIDEPTNHLDMDARKTLAAYLNAKRGFILVSHDRTLLDGCVDHILSITRAGIELQKGNFSSWQINRRRQDEFEETQNRRLTREITALNEAAGRAARWSDRVEKTKNVKCESGLKPDKGHIGHQAAKLMKRARAIEGRRQRAADQKTVLLKNVESSESLALSPLDWPKPRLLDAAERSLCYGERQVFSGLSFALVPGERLAICGPNGCGKSSLLRLILRETAPTEGRLTLGSGLTVSHVPQDPSFLRGGLRDYAKRSGIELSLFLAILRKLDFPRAQFEKDMSVLSAGQQKKVLLARSLCQRAHLYLWDEPLNYVDVLSRMQIEELIVKYRPTMLFVEHDAAFVKTVATRRLEMGGGD
jgi:lincosamide and streptogramin A transport system ATP-binding/permease protein